MNTIEISPRVKKLDTKLVLQKEETSYYEDMQALYQPSTIEYLELANKIKKSKNQERVIHEALQQARLEY